MGKITLPHRQNGDIREYKKDLRAQCKAVRSEMSGTEKLEKDEAVFNRVISSRAYKDADTLLTYVSTDIEVDTLRLINKAIEDKKRVAVPRCVTGTREMDFYFISSLDDLESGAFGVREPVPEKCELASSYENALCIIPGLAFDMKGFRLGYGKGYYDRFLSAHPSLVKMGLCYCSCTVSELVHGHFDVSADMLATEKYLRRII